MSTISERLASALGGSYTIERELTGGGMALVFVADDHDLDRKVVIKILPPEMAASVSAERFRREILTVARLQHPHIVPVLKAGDLDGLPYFVMPYVDGESLDVTLRRRHTLGVREALGIMKDVARALAFAHERNVVHRDIKPGNILVAEDGALKVGDFGIAKAAFVSGDITTTGNILGTVTYISPEQARGEEPDARSDLYSLGIVLYQLLLGRPPFAAETQIGTAMKHVQEAPLSPRSIKAGIPKGLEAAILKSLEKQPGDRFSSAAEMRTALQRSAAGGRTTAMRTVDRSRAPTPEQPAQSTSSLAAFRWLIPVVLAVVAVVALALYLPSVIGTNDRNPGPGHTTQPGGGGNPGGKAIPIASVRSFDPEGDGREHPELVDEVHDGNPATGWHTEDYTSPLQGQKPGVGLLFDLGSSSSVDEIRVTSQTPGYSFELRAGDQPGATETSFKVVKTVAGASGAEDVTFAPTTDRYWLVWITSLPGGGAGTAYLNEVKFFGPSG
jgi:serine/threonine-protein kinase